MVLRLDTFNVLFSIYILITRFLILTISIFPILVLLYGLCESFEWKYLYEIGK